ncbi:MAG: hypothetical protein IJ214_12400 [Clostridia bacterium]|nr:hypothetical protein [Clostridia bacterium]
MNRIRLNDGAEYPVYFCGESEGVLAFLLPAGQTLRQIAEIFGGGENMERVVYLLPNEAVPDVPTAVAAFDGYTRLIGITADRYNGRILVQLIKEA